MKKHISYLVLGVLTIPLISELAKADTPTNSYLEIIDDYIVPNQLNSTQSECENYINSDGPKPKKKLAQKTFQIKLNLLWS